MAVRSLKELPKDLNKKISRDFNNLVKDVHAELSSEQNMPVWTGFFASSWKASNTPVSATHDIMDYQPWASIKYEVFLGFKNTGQSTRPENPVVQPRFPVEKAREYLIIEKEFLLVIKLIILNMF